jgi:pimeloyl-ACP methyl ester carboxylesterase
VSTNERTTADIRADGPPVVQKGPTGQTAVVVLDPLGDAKHGELPATWRSLAEDVDVVWLRLPTMLRDGSDARSVVDDLDRAGRTLHIVGCCEAALLALTLARKHESAVRSLVLVDPPWPPGDKGIVRDFIGDLPLPVSEVATGPDEALPIGHPEVVRAVLQALVSGDLWPDGPRPDAESAPRLPGAESLLSEAWQAARTRLAGLLETLGGERNR